jgi:hypothetical protein
MGSEAEETREFARFPWRGSMREAATAETYHDFVGEEVGEGRDTPVADVGLRVNVEVLKPYFYCRIVNPNSAKPTRIKA